MPDCTRSGNSAASCPTYKGPRSASRSRICRRVESASVRNRASLLLRITCAHHIGQPVENSVQVGAALIILYRVTPLRTTDSLESIVNEGHTRSGSRGSKRDDQSRRIDPPTALLEPGQDQALLRHQLQHNTADPRLVIGAEEAVCASDTQIDLNVGTHPLAQSFLGCQPPPDLARTNVDLDRTNDLRHPRPPLHSHQVMHYYTVICQRCQLRATESCEGGVAANSRARDGTRQGGRSPVGRKFAGVPADPKQRAVSGGEEEGTEDLSPSRVVMA